MMINIDSDWKKYFIVTGGGCSLLSNITEESCSKYFLGWETPYDPNYTKELVGDEKLCSKNAARRLAVKAYLKARKSTYRDHNQENTRVPYRAMGVGASFSIATENERKGRQHKFHVCCHSKYYTNEKSFVTDQNFTRNIEEYMCKFLIQECCEEHIDGYYPYFTSYNKGYQNSEETLIFPGSFNPVHDGHLQMMEIAEQITKRRLAFEISRTNYEKEEIDYLTIRDRTEKLPRTCILSNAPLFEDKVKLCKPNTIFVVGVDTWSRLYHSRSGNLDFRKDKNVKFIVFPRNEIVEFADLDYVISHPLVEAFNCDLSSTKIRKDFKKAFGQKNNKYEKNN